MTPPTSFPAQPGPFTIPPNTTATLLLDQTWLGLHPFYRRRLASAFAVRRLRNDQGKVFADPYPFSSEGTPLSDYARPPAGGPFPR